MFCKAFFFFKWPQFWFARLAEIARKLFFLRGVGNFPSHKNKLKCKIVPVSDGKLCVQQLGLWGFEIKNTFRKVWTWCTTHEFCEVGPNFQSTVVTVLSQAWGYRCWLLTPHADISYRYLWLQISVFHISRCSKSNSIVHFVVAYQNKNTSGTHVVLVNSPTDMWLKFMWQSHTRTLVSVLQLLLLPFIWKLTKRNRI